MKNESSGSAVLFLAIVWVLLLMFLAYGVYKDAVQLTNPKTFKIINLEDLMNGRTD